MGTGAFADQGLGLEKIDSLPRAILALAVMSSMGAASAIRFSFSEDGSAALTNDVSLALWLLRAGPTRRACQEGHGP